MIFGTDGIRARLGDYPLDETTISRLSHVLENWLRPEIKVVIGSDTRASCDDLKRWVTSYLDTITVIDLGIVPTPVVAYEVKARGANLGIMITASHNPAQDNGLKFFDGNGLKIQYDLAKNWSHHVVARDNIGPERPARLNGDTASNYRAFIKRHFKPSHFKGLRVAFDLANGAGASFVKELCADLKIDAVFTGDEPDGQNINDGVGALHLHHLSNFVEKHNLDVGFALDGDGDRLALAAPQPIKGDIMLYALYLTYKQEGHRIPALVGTIMCGMGLQQKLHEEGVELIRTPVGDQNVLHEMVERKLPLGGETSGHLIQADLFPAGDGFLGALRIARAMAKDRNLLKDAVANVPLYPVYEEAFKVRHKPPLETIEDLKTQVMVIRGQLGDTGRLIIRYSGTEPKLRLYVEAPDLAPFKGGIDDLKDIIAAELQ
ncbi:MAG: hypothetical protein QNK37_17120 [Acidobacteriota bacterium]|nr:hypothetical protein [Acidobacteriota bacterium]